MATLLIAAVFALGGLPACSYYDPVPGTIHLKTTLGGKPQSCMVEVFTAAGKQVQLVGINDGKADIEQLAPGAYTLKFEGVDKSLYPAVRHVQLFQAGEITLAVELSETGEAGTVVGSSAER